MFSNLISRVQRLFVLKRTLVQGDFSRLRTKDEEIRERQRYKKKSRSQQRKSRVFASIYGKQGLVSLSLSYQFWHLLSDVVWFFLCFDFYFAAFGTGHEKIFLFMRPSRALLKFPASRKKWNYAPAMGIWLRSTFLTFQNIIITEM